jgi:hypothetical protein
LQLEARQLADTERQIASETTRSAQGEAGRDALRRLAGEQDRLTDRARRIQDGLKQQATEPAPTGSGDKTSTSNLQGAAREALRDLERQRLVERMQQSASAMRAEADRGERDANGRDPGRTKAAAESQREVARGFDKLADKLASADPTSDGESRRLSGQLARTRGLRERLDSLTRELDTLGQPNGRPGDDPRPSFQRGESAQASSPAVGRGARESSGSDAARARLSDQLNREIQQARELLDQLQREDKERTLGGGRGFTFEAPGNMVLSAPGTEAFKQDFAKWQELKKQATGALELAETALAKKLQEKQSKDRLAAGVDDKAPPEYQQQVDSYFKALAAKKK